METISITLTVPAELAQQAGLLTNEVLTDWLKMELNRHTEQRLFFTTIDQLTTLESRLTLEEIQAEIDVARAE